MYKQITLLYNKLILHCKSTILQWNKQSLSKTLGYRRCGYCCSHMTYGPLWNHPFHSLVQALFGFLHFFLFVCFAFLVIFNLLADSFILGLHCCTWAFSSFREWGLLWVAVHSSLTAAASLAVEHRFQVHKLQQLRLPGSRAWAHRLQLLHVMWNLPRPGIKPVTPHWQGILIHCITGEVPLVVVHFSSLSILPFLTLLFYCHYNLYFKPWACLE